MSRHPFFHPLLPAIALGMAVHTHAQLTVGAATELRPVVTELVRVYGERTGNPVRILFAPPATLLQQTAQGSYDCILAPSEWIDSAVARGLSLDPARELGVAPIAAWSRQDAPLPDSALGFLLDTTIHGIVFSDPAQSPDGARLLPFLEALGADSSYRTRWRKALEPSAAVDTVLAGRADAALLPQSAIWSSALAGLGRQILLDSSRIAPQRIRSLVLKVHPDRQANANAFIAWTQGPVGKGIWRRKGFLLP